MEKQPFDALPLRATHELITGAVLPTIADPSVVETAFSKTEDGYVWEIRTLQPGKVFRTDALSITNLYEKLENFVTLDSIRSFMEGVSIHLGLLADKLENNE